jgi:hypothetical protein
VALLAFTLVGLAACGEGTQTASPWPLDASEARGARMIRGVYRVELERKSGDCSPSIEDYTKYPGWPPARVPVEVGLDGTSELFGGFDHIQVRKGWLQNRATDLDANKRPPDPIYASIRQGTGDTNQDPVSELRCTDDPTRVETVIRAPAEGVLTVAVDADWRGLENCGTPEELASRPWLPNASCTETYRLRYELEKRCPSRCDLGGWIESRYEDGFQYETFRADRGEFCNCEDDEQ